MADHQPDLEPRALAQVVGDERVEGIRGGHGELAALDGDRTHRVLPEVLGRQILQNGQGRRQLVAGEIREVELAGQTAQHVLGRDRAHGDKDLADPLAGLLGPRHSLGHHLGCRHALFHEDVTEQSRGGCNGHAMLSRHGSTGSRHDRRYREELRCV
jgi:hypothetical protein